MADWLSIVILTDKTELHRILRMAQKNQLVTDYEAPMLTFTRKKIWVLLSANIITKFEDHDALFVTFNEITARNDRRKPRGKQSVFAEALGDSVSALNSTLEV